MVYFIKGREIPDHLWELGLAVRTLIERYDAMDSWRRHVREWVKHVREAADYPGIVVMHLPQKLEIDEEYALLAAIHDNCASRNEELIHPWAAEEDFGGPKKVVTVNPEALHAISTYIFLMAHVLPEQERRGIERSKADRLLKILQHVASDVRKGARLWTPNRSICADESAPDPVEEYASFLRRADAETGNAGSTTQAKQDDETTDDKGQPPAPAHESQPAVKTADAAGEDAKHAPQHLAPPPAPKKRLVKWREILIALGMQNNRESRQTVDLLSEQYDGPIIKRGQGTHPLVDEDDLLKWWDKVLEIARSKANRDRDMKEAVKGTHPYGREGEVVPEIVGSVKRRRKDRQT